MKYYSNPESQTASHVISLVTFNHDIHCLTLTAAFLSVVSLNMNFGDHDFLMADSFRLRLIPSPT